MTKKHSKNNYSDNVMKTIAYIMSTYHIGTHNLDIRDVLKSYIIARYYGWEPKEEDLEEIISNTSYWWCYLRSPNNAKRRNNHLKQWEQQILYQESPSVRMVIKY